MAGVAVNTRKRLRKLLRTLASPSIPCCYAKKNKNPRRTAFDGGFADINALINAAEHAAPADFIYQIGVVI